MRALVTGGGGFLGTRIVQMLRARGDDVVALGRGSYPHLQAEGIETVRADIRDVSAVRTACRGMDVVFHAAAIPGIWGRRKTFRQINVEGTRHVIDACRACGVAKLVFTSSPSVVFGANEACGIDESEPYPPRHIADYPQTKAEAERMVLAANGSGLLTVAIRPHLIWGPGDPHLIPRVISRARRKRLIQVGDGTNLVDVTYVDNAAEAHILAADALSQGAACAGRAYFISQGEPVALWPWFDSILRAVGAPRVERSMSFAVAYRLGGFLELVYRAVGARREPIMTRFLATQLAYSRYLDIGAAKRDLGYRPRVSMSVGLERLFESLGVGEEWRSDDKKSKDPVCQAERASA